MPIMLLVLYLYGEWLTAGIFMSLALLVAFLGVVGLGWWVLRADAQNRRQETTPDETAEQH